MVSYEIPKPPQSFLNRLRDSARLAFAYAKGDRTTVSDITSTTQFSPLQPIQPMTPQIAGRGWDYPVGLNVQYQPRGYGSGRIPFAQLRNISLSCEILRLVIETVKDQICSFPYGFMPKEGSSWTPDDSRLAMLEEFFEMPDKVHTFEQWERMVFEEFIVTDAVSIYRPKDKVGRPYAFEIMDGATIKPLIDQYGRRPVAPDPAYQQIIKGAPRADYDTTELLYMPRNKLAYQPLYGLSIVEQVLLTAQTSLERQKYQLAYFTEGSVPDAYGKMPPEMTVAQVKAFQDEFNNILSGNARERRQVPMLPGGASIEQMKEEQLKNDFDEWIARIACFALGIAPTAFIKQMNRSTAQTDQERAEEEGQAPKLKYFKKIVDTLIADFGPEFAANVEFVYKESKNIDPKEQADVLKELVGSALKTINEGRSDLGLDPVEGGDEPMVLTPTGYVPLDSFEQQQQMQQQNMQAQAEAKQASADAMANQNKNKPPADGAAGNDSAGKLLGKAVRPKAIPFRARLNKGGYRSSDATDQGHPCDCKAVGHSPDQCPHKGS